MPLDAEQHKGPPGAGCKASCSAWVGGANSSLLTVFPEARGRDQPGSGLRDRRGGPPQGEVDATELGAMQDYPPQAQVEPPQGPPGQGGREPTSFFSSQPRPSPQREREEGRRGQRGEREGTGRGEGEEEKGRRRRRKEGAHPVPRQPSQGSGEAPGHEVGGTTDNKKARQRQQLAVSRGAALRRPGEQRHPRRKYEDSTRRFHAGALLLGPQHLSSQARVPAWHPTSVSPPRGTQRSAGSCASPKHPDKTWEWCLKTREQNRKARNHHQPWPWPAAPEASPRLAGAPTGSQHSMATTNFVQDMRAVGERLLLKLQRLPQAEPVEIVAFSVIVLFTATVLLLLLIACSCCCTHCCCPEHRGRKVQVQPTPP
ncbi:small integral membrane protein 5 isoform X1 [Saimiri boliviensis]